MVLGGENRVSGAGPLEEIGPLVRIPGSDGLVEERDKAVVARVRTVGLNVIPVGGTALDPERV